jgi:hypothetical protein
MGLESPNLNDPCVCSGMHIILVHDVKWCGPLTLLSNGYEGLFPWDKEAEA